MKNANDLKYALENILLLNNFVPNNEAEYEKEGLLRLQDILKNVKNIVDNFNNLDKCKQEAQKIKSLLSSNKKVPQEQHTIEQSILGLLYFHELIDCKDLKEVFRLIEIGAKGNYAFAQYTLAIMYAKGIGTEVDVIKSLEFLTYAAERNNVKAIIVLGKIYYTGISSSVAIDAQKAVQLFEKALAQGYQEIIPELGAIYMRGLANVKKDVKRAIELFEILIKKDDPRAMVTLGLLYRVGDEELPKDGKKAVEYFESAVKLGGKEAAFHLADMYLKGDGVSVNEALAAHYFQIHAGGDARKAETMKAVCSTYSGPLKDFLRSVGRPDQGQQTQKFQEILFRLQSQNGLQLQTHKSEQPKREQQAPQLLQKNQSQPSRPLQNKQHQQAQQQAHQNLESQKLKQSQQPQQHQQPSETIPEPQSQAIKSKKNRSKKKRLGASVMQPQPHSQSQATKTYTNSSQPGLPDRLGLSADSLLPATPMHQATSALSVSTAQSPSPALFAIPAISDTSALCLTQAKFAVETKADLLVLDKEPVLPKPLTSNGVPNVPAVPEVPEVPEVSGVPGTNQEKGKKEQDQRVAVQQSLAPGLTGVIAANGVQPAPQKPKESKKLKETISCIIYSKEVILGEELGQGGFGIVYKGTWSDTTVAVKKLKSKELSAENKENFSRECNMMANLRHPNIAQFIGHCPSDYFFVMEHAEKGSLYSVIQTEKPPADDIRMKMGEDTACAVAFLHSKKVLHRDFKSKNILVKSDNTIKVTDFGLSKIKFDSQASSSVNHSDFVGTFAWMAPELVTEKGKYTKAADVYSMAIVFWEIWAWKTPYSKCGVQPFMIPYKVKEGMREKILDHFPEQYKSVIPLMWSADPKARPRAYEVSKFLRQRKVRDFLKYCPDYKSRYAQLVQKNDITVEHDKTGKGAGAKR